jgi:hypothetical protein
MFSFKYGKINYHFSFDSLFDFITRSNLSEIK